MRVEFLQPGHDVQTNHVAYAFPFQIGAVGHVFLPDFFQIGEDFALVETKKGTYDIAVPWIHA